MHQGLLLTSRQDEVQAEQDGMKKAVAEWEALPAKIGKAAEALRQRCLANDL